MVFIFYIYVNKTRHSFQEDLGYSFKKNSQKIVTFQRVTVSCLLKLKAGCASKILYDRTESLSTSRVFITRSFSLAVYDEREDFEIYGGRVFIRLEKEKSRIKIALSSLPVRAASQLHSITHTKSPTRLVASLAGPMCDITKHSGIYTKATPNAAELGFSMNNSKPAKLRSLHRPVSAREHTDTLSLVLVFLLSLFAASRASSETKLSVQERRWHRRRRR